MDVILMPGRILVSPIKAMTKTKSGLFIPETAQKDPKSGKVLLTAPYRIGEDKYMFVKPGDEILYIDYAGIPAEIDGRSYLIMTEEDILVILNPENRRAKKEEEKGCENCAKCD